MTDTALAFQSIAGTGALYRSGQLSPVELTQLYLQRIETLNPALNAFITVTPELALSQARQAEAELRSGEDRGPLHGIPIAVKDLIDTAGVPTTCASRILREHVPAMDAALVQHLRAAGAIILGKTNMSEFAMGVAHPDYGQVNNPWDQGRTAGASSGGSAAAVAAGLCSAAVGSDTGGSIRIPASYCGLAGLKPTAGLVSLQGVFPLAPSLDHAGPLARSSADAALLLGGLTGRPVDSAALPSLKGCRFGVLPSPGQVVRPEVQTVFEEACEVLRSAGAQLLEVSLAEQTGIDAALFHTLLPEAAVVHDRWLQERPGDYAPLTLQQLEPGASIPATAYVRAQHYRQELRNISAAALTQVDALISPTVPFLAPRTDPVWHSPEGETEGYFTVLHNLTGFPALSVCAGCVGDLPVGLQVTTAPHTDFACLALGRAIEAHLQMSRVPG